MLSETMPLPVSAVGGKPRCMTQRAIITRAKYSDRACQPLHRGQSDGVRLLNLLCEKEVLFLARKRKRVLNFRFVHCGPVPSCATGARGTAMHMFANVTPSNKRLASFVCEIRRYDQTCGPSKRQCPPHDKRVCCTVSFSPEDDNKNRFHHFDCESDVFET